MLFSIRYCVTTINWTQGVSKLNNFKLGIGYGLRNKDSILQIQNWSQSRQFCYLFNTNINSNFKYNLKHSETCGFVAGELVGKRTLKTKKIVNGEPQGIHESISALQMKTRLQRRKRLSPEEEEDRKKHGFWNVVAYATAEEYNLEKLTKGLLQENLYTPVKQPKSLERNQLVADVLHVTARYQVDSEPREIYFFREGSTVFWNVPELEASNVLNFIKQFEENSYDERMVHDESEVMPYTHSSGKNSCLQNGDIVIADEANLELDKYTFSNVMALSVKLGIWEASLNRYVDSIEYVTEDLKSGRKIRISKEEVLRKTGELFALRHVINLSSDLLDIPDFYWDHEEQENLYQQLSAYFSINRRTRVMNEKLNHCVELVELLSSHLSDKHHIRLEWMIIILIMVEVGFEIIHYVDRYL